MGKRANPAMIGAFIVGAVALIVIGLLVFGRGRFFADTQKFVLYFDGSVKGLNVGAPVDFQGVRVGSVINVRSNTCRRKERFAPPCTLKSNRGASRPWALGRMKPIAGNSCNRWSSAVCGRGWRCRAWSPANYSCSSGSFPIPLSGWWEATLKSRSSRRFPPPSSRPKPQRRTSWRRSGAAPRPALRARHADRSGHQSAGEFPRIARTHTTLSTTTHGRYPGRSCVSSKRQSHRCSTRRRTTSAVARTLIDRACTNWSGVSMARLYP